MTIHAKHLDDRRDLSTPEKVIGPMPKRVPQAVETIAVITAIAHLVLQAVLYRHPYRPDEGKALDYFIGSWTPARSLEAEMLTRIALFAISISILSVLRRAKLVDSWTITLAYVWPMTVFLFSKIYWEFFVFPFCLIRTDVSRRSEIGLISGFLAAWIVVGEGNLVILAGWRFVLLVQKTGFRVIAVTAPILLGIVLDRVLASAGASSIPIFGESFARFNWTRTVANPEYTPFETLGVFIASMHFFSLHDGAVWIDIGFSALTLLIIAWQDDFRTLVRERGWEIAGFVAVLFSVTHVTHAFQNARYFYFYLPLLAAVTPKNRYGLLVFVGFSHVLVRAFWL